MNRSSLEQLVNPRSIAIIGASDKPGYGSRFYNNIRKNHYQGEIYLINPRREEIYGIKCYPSILAVNAHVDLAVIIIKAQFVEQAVKECAEKGVGSVLIITAGFGEADPVEGRAAERRMAQLAKESGMRIVGPNCIGLANVKEGIWACSMSTLKEDPLPKGNTALVSQSGATGFGPLLTTACDHALGMKYIVTTGNEMDVDLCEMIDFLLDDEEIRSVAAYIEGIKDGTRLIQIAKKARTLGKTIIVQKIGESSVGSRAAASHTASLTGDMAVFNAVVKQYGMLKASDYDELVEMLNITQMEQKLMGRRLAVLSHSGGVSGFLGDQLGKHGFEIPVLKQETQEKIDAFLNGFGSARNPLDLSAHIRKPEIVDIILTVEKNEDVDGYVFATHGDVAAMENVVRAAQSVKGKPVFFVWTGSVYDEGLAFLKQQGFPISFSIVKFGDILSKVFEAGSTNVNNAILPETIHFSADSLHGYVNEVDAKRVLTQAGVPTPVSCVVTSRKQMQEVAASLDPYKKYVMKIVSDTIIHKSDIGGVLVGIQGLEQMLAAYDRLAAIRGERPDEIKGILIEEMCEDGLDLVLGIRGDEQFGQVVMLGMGGIYTELFKLVSCRVLPLGGADILDMIDEIGGLRRLLDGYRGAEGYDIEAFVGAVEKTCAFAWEIRDVLDLVEINPIRVMPGSGGVQALDCVIKVK